MGRFNSEMYDKVFPRPTKTKVVESAVEHFKETETEVEEVETKEEVVETEVIETEVETEVEETEVE